MGLGVGSKSYKGKNFLKEKGIFMYKLFLHIFSVSGTKTWYIKLRENKMGKHSVKYL